MPAFRGINLRSGDLAEQLGILLLQSVTLVAPVPRTEDVGIDAVVTLIKNYDQYKYIAEESFVVQIKSSSITEVSFQKDEVKWLCDLQLPLFLASVDRNTSAIKLYTTHGLSDVIVENPDRTEINLQLLHNYKSDIGNKDASINLPIGPPVIEWSLDLIASKPKFIEEFYEIMKSHVSLAKKSIDTRRIGFVELAAWETGKQPNIYESKISPVKDKNKLDETTAPYFNTLLHDLMLGDDLFTIRSLYQLLEKKLEREGHFVVVGGKRELKKWTAPEYEKIIKQSTLSKEDDEP